MSTSQPERDMLHAITEWARARSAIRAVLLTSTRAIPNGRIDALSDYDVILVVQDIHPFADDRAWINDFGDVLVVYWDPIQPDPDFGIDYIANVTQYADGLKIDFTLWSVALFQQIVAAHALPAELDAGYRVLLDKDHLTATLRAPTASAYIPARPTDTEFQTLINDFLSDPPYAAKCLWRDELLPAKWCLDNDMKHIYLRQLLEWQIEIDHGWSLPTGSLGKGLKKHLSPETWAQLEASYAGAGLAENWAALANTMALFRQVAIQVGAQLGYAYPHDLDRRVSAYVDQIRRMEPPTAPIQNEPSPESQTDQTLATIMHFHATFNTHDVDAIMRLMSDDCVFENTAPAPDGTRLVGQAAVRAAWEALFRDSPQAAFAVEEAFAAGDRGVIRWRYTWGVPTAAAGHVRGVDIFRVHDGKVAEKLSYVKG